MATEIILPNRGRAMVRVVQRPDHLDGGKWDVEVVGGPGFHVWAGGRDLVGVDLNDCLPAIGECIFDDLVRPPEKRAGEWYETHLRADHFREATERGSEKK